MMQGDPKVDELMRPVLAAIERHVKDREAATEIYNRAYEAVMNSMDVNAESILAHENDKAYWINREHGMQAEVARLTAALREANEDAERLADKLSEVVAYGGYYADIENRMPPDGQTFKVIAVSPSGVDDFTVLRMDGKLYFASDPPREVPRGFEIIRIKPWDVKTFGKTEEEDF